MGFESPWKMSIKHRFSYQKQHFFTLVKIGNYFIIIGVNSPK